NDSSYGTGEHEGSMPSLSTGRIQVLDSYGKDWASVDKIGLTATAASQAGWQVENPSPRKKTKKSGIQLVTNPLKERSPQRKRSSAPLSLGSDIGYYSSKLPLTLPDIVRQDLARGSGSGPKAPSWENRVVPVTTIQGHLVDDSDPYTNSIRPRRPPGLSSKSESTRTRAILPPPWGGDEADQALLTFDNFPTLASSSQSRPLHPRLPSNASQPDSASSATRAADEGDVVVECLQTLVDESARRKFTMNQKTQKKGKGKGKGSGNSNHLMSPNKVELPLPDPVPPPRQGKQEGTMQDPIVVPASPKRKASAPQEPETPKKSKAEAALNANTMELAETSEQARIPRSSAMRGEKHHGRPLAAELRDIVSIAQPSRTGLSLAVHFGVILFAYKDKLLRKTTFHLGAFHDEAVGEAKLFPRLTTSTTDAKYVLELTADTSLTRARSLYEFHLRDSAGVLRIVTRDARGVAQPGRSADEIVGTVDMHHPYRAWDARYMIKAAPRNPFAEEAVGQLIASMKTVDAAPAFYARIPAGAGFAVERVLAKREFHRTAARGGAEIVVTEARELRLESLREPLANLKASLGSREEMMAQQRLWWECRVVAARVEDAGVLEGLVEGMITGMDGVGFGNKGPWQPRVVEPVAEEVIPFW
ncbi:hypothetical protein LTR53_012193, partial [Teratosphaeriaceae sp. CCFEE 6253]